MHSYCHLQHIAIYSKCHKVNIVIVHQRQIMINLLAQMKSALKQRAWRMHNSTVFFTLKNAVFLHQKTLIKYYNPDFI